jgi:hypothetical protein
VGAPPRGPPRFESPPAGYGDYAFVLHILAAVAARLVKLQTEVAEKRTELRKRTAKFAHDKAKAPLAKREGHRHKAAAEIASPPCSWIINRCKRWIPTKKFPAGSLREFCRKCY